jgi:ribosomal protein L6P/L9E
MSHIGRQPIIIHTPATPANSRPDLLCSAGPGGPVGLRHTGGVSVRVATVQLPPLKGLRRPNAGGTPASGGLRERSVDTKTGQSPATQARSGVGAGLRCRAPRSFLKITASRGFTIYCPSSFLLQKRLDIINQAAAAVGPKTPRSPSGPTEPLGADAAERGASGLGGCVSIGGVRVVASGALQITRSDPQAGSAGPKAPGADALGGSRLVGASRSANLECGGSLRSLLSQMVQGGRPAASRVLQSSAEGVGRVQSEANTPSQGPAAQAGYAGSLAYGTRGGAREGRRLTIQGVGYRAETLFAPDASGSGKVGLQAGVAGPKGRSDTERVLRLFVGYGHPVDIVVPKTITVQCPNPTTILVNGDHYQEVAQFVAKVRLIRPVRPGSPLPAAKKGIAHAL